METLTYERLNYQHLLDKPRVYADLNAGWRAGDDYVIPLNSRATESDLRQRGHSLRSGLVVDFWTDDGDAEGNPDPLLFQGVVRFDEDAQGWVAVTGWNDFTHFSDLDRPAEDVNSITRRIVFDTFVKYDYVEDTPPIRPGAVPNGPLKKP